MIRIPKIALGMLVLFLMFVSLGSLASTSETVKDKASTPVSPTLPPVTPVPFAPVVSINDLPLQDNKNVFQYDDPDSIIVMYITVRKGNSLENTNYTWAEVNSFNKWLEGSRSADLVVGQAEAILQIGDENGPLPGELGYNVTVPNATIQIRGASSTEEIQKSYKIELDEGAGEWRGQSTLALNKHIFDVSRLRNKISFDLMKQIPNMISLRTQFVHLYVKDQTVEPWSDKFVDYGLFTQVEQVNRRFLKNHRLDPNGQLYKATSFDFDRRDDVIRTEDDPLYNEEAFSNLLEIKGNHDHSKLIRMLDAINDTEIPIEQSFEKYFDQENYFTWLAFNIIVGNIDTQDQNFFLYSPLNSEKWYIIPWDYDTSFSRLGREEFHHSSNQYFETGVANYWGVILHNRVLKVDKYHAKLDDKITELMKILTPEKLQGMLDAYRPVVEPYIFRVPDYTYYSGSRLEFDKQFSVFFPAEIQTNYDLYLDTLKRPMPYYLDRPEITGGKMVFRWDEAYNFIPQDVTYRFQVSKDFYFSNIVYEKDIINLTTEETPIPKPGKYFWRVIASNLAGKVQYSIESYVDTDGHLHDGMRSFTITADGEVIEE
jgi:spore coat protein H